MLYPLDLRRTHGEGGHKLYYRVYIQILPSFILSPKVPLFSNPKNIIPCSPQSESTVCISFTLPLFNEHYLINLSFAIRPISIHSIYAPIMSRQRHVIDDTLFSYVFCTQNIIKKTLSETSTSLLYQNTRFLPTRIWNQESTSSVRHVSLMWSLIFVFLSASCSWKKNFIQLLNWLISKWFYILVQVQITETPQKLADLNQIVESLHKFQDVTSKILEAVF